MNAFSVAFQGLRAAFSAPKLLLGLWLLNVLVALPAAVLMAGTLERSIGPSLFHETLREGFDYDWYEEYRMDSRGGFEASFRPSILGAGAVYDNLELWWSGRLFTGFPGLVALGAAYAIVWAFVLGGVLAVLAPRGPDDPAAVSFHGFLAAGGRTFARFLGLTAMAGVVYYLVYRLARFLFGAIDDASRDVTVEGTVYVRVLAVTALVIVLLHLVRMIFDYAKIAIVASDEATSEAEGGLNVLRALFAGLRFVFSRPLAAIVVYLVPSLLALGWVALYAAVAPGAGQSSFATVLAAFLVSQLFLAGRLALRLGLLGAELRLFLAASPSEPQM